VGSRLAAALAVVLVTAAVTAAPPARALDVADANSLALSATYDVHATFGWDDREVTVSTVAVVTNTARWPVSVLAFNLAALRTGDARVGEVAVDGTPATPAIDDQTVVVPLAQELGPTETATVSIRYSARLHASASVDGDAWEFARIDDVLTAYRWIPWLSRTTRFNRPNVGDPFVTASSPHIRVSITTDRDVAMATSGRRVNSDGLTQVFEASNVRDFNFAASTSYRTRSTTVGQTTITFFYRTLPADAVLATAARALRDFGDKIAPYPFPTLTIAEIGPWSAFESPAHFWVGDNTPQSLLAWTVAHEVAHQWFYSVVGNDQAREPFADEALADFMARNLLSKFVDSKCAPDRLDQSIYDIGDCYAWVIYVQGVALLRAYRDRVGANAFWRGLADYYADHRFGIGSTRAALDALAAASGVEVDHRRFPSLYRPVVVSLPFGPVFR
jgi:hypothetical protein